MHRVVALLAPLALMACADTELQGRLQLELLSDVPGARLDLFAADTLDVSLAEQGRAVGRAAAIAPVVKVAHAPGRFSLDLLAGAPDAVPLVLVAWADADGDGRLDVDPAGTSETARVPRSDGDLLVDVTGGVELWQGTVRSLAGTRPLDEGHLAGWSVAVSAAREGPPLLDSDDDGIDDDSEVALGTDPFAVDTDADGEPDGAELGDVAEPSDRDDDGVLDALEPGGVDDDGDGADAEQDPDEQDPCVPSADACDSDNDDLSDAEEDELGTDPFDPDTDGDGETDGFEAADGDGDGISDALERGDADADGDGTNDEDDPADGDPCVPVEIPGCAGDPPPPP